MPALRYSDGTIDEIITESAIITQFLADAHPSHLLPASDRSPRAALFRARVNFFVDAFFSKVHPILFAIVKETSAAERERKGDEVVKVVEKELEPLLAQASPFFGGNEAFTLAEVCICVRARLCWDTSSLKNSSAAVAPLPLRTHGILPASSFCLSPYTPPSLFPRLPPQAKNPPTQQVKLYNAFLT